MHSFSSLMAELASRARVTYGLTSDPSSPTFKQIPEPTPQQAKAYQLLALLPVTGNLFCSYPLANQQNTV